MRPLIIFLFFLFSGSSLKAQDLIQTYYKKGSDFELTNIDSAKYYFHLVDSLAYKNQDTLMVQTSLYFHAGYYATIGDMENAIVFCEKAWPYCQDTLSKIQNLLSYSTAMRRINVEFADSLFRHGINLTEAYDKPFADRGPFYNNYGIFLAHRGKLGKSIRYLQLGIDHSISPFNKLQGYTTILNVFETMQNYVLTEEYILKAIAIAEKENFKSRNGMIALHYAKLLTRQGATDKAKGELERAKNFKPFGNPKDFKNSYLITEGVYCETEKNWQRLSKVLSSEEKEIQKLGLSNYPSILRLKARSNFQQGQLGLAETFAVSGLEQSKKQNRKTSERLSHKLLGLIYTAQEKYKKSSFHITEAERLAEEIYRNNQAQTINYLEAEHNRQEQALSIANLQLENDAQEKIVLQQKQKLMGGAIALGFISLLSFFLYHLYKKVNSQKELITKSLADKEILLREIHHRVKNNLQLVSSLLTLQGRSIEDATAIEAINEGKSRVRSMALIHQDLYHQENLTEINVKSYLEKLTQELFTTYRIDANKLELKMDIQDIELDVDTLVPLGLIINELISNSLKYAFPNNRAGKLIVKLLEPNHQDLLLHISDNGVGYDPMNVRENSFGATLIAALSEQLGGTLNTQTELGTLNEILFSNYRNN